MSRIPDEVIEQVRDTADLLEIVQEQVPLKRTGSDWRGACPFHGGTHRNFAVFPKEQRYYCFVCHVSGDVFTWYRERLGMDYPTAVREVARRYGIAVPESRERPGPDPREPLFQACDAAAIWFAAQLREHPDAARARNYLLEREVSLDIAATQGLGYAPRGDAFIAAMRSLGVGEDVLVEASLARRRDDGALAPRFRERLLFPIHDLRGRVVAFGGRLLGPGEPKYLNSAESPIFHKGEQLYHLHAARHAIRKEGYVIVVEGYFDVLRLQMHGVDATVAPLGTALTESQAALLRRYTGEAVLLFDSDAPGLKATFRSGDTLLASGMRVRVATLPPGDDPDTLARRGGAEAIARVIGDAIDVLDRKLQLLETRGWFESTYRTREALDRLLPTLRAVTEPVLRELYITRVAERLRIPRERVAMEAATTVAAPSPIVPGAEPRVPRGVRRPGAEIERKLLRLLSLFPVWLDRARHEVDVDRFTVPVYRDIYAALRSLEPGAVPADAIAHLTSDARQAWDRLVDSGMPGDGFDADREYSGAVEALNEIHTFPDIAAEPDPSVRNRRWSALSKEGQARYKLYTEARRRGERSTSKAEE